MTIRNCNIKSSHCVDTGHNFDLAETKILIHGKSWSARLSKEAWLSYKKLNQQMYRIATGLLSFASSNLLTVSHDRCSGIQQNLFERMSKTQSISIWHVYGYCGVWQIQGFCLNHLALPIYPFNCLQNRVSNTEYSTKFMNSVTMVA